MTTPVATHSIQIRLTGDNSVNDTYEIWVSLKKRPTPDSWINYGRVDRAENGWVAYNDEYDIEMIDIDRFAAAVGLVADVLSERKNNFRQTGYRGNGN